MPINDDKLEFVIDGKVALSFDKKAKTKVVNNVEKAKKEIQDKLNAGENIDGLFRYKTKSGKLSDSKFFTYFKTLEGSYLRQYFNKSKKTGKFRAGINENVELSSILDEFNIEYKQPKQSKATVGNSIKKTISPIGKLINTIKRVGFYRLARGFFATLKNIFTEGISGLAQFDKSANKTVSELTSSYDKLKASVAISIMPLLEAITPIITQISNGIASVANSISKANAKSKGLTEYTRVNAEYSKDFADNMNSALLSFDKFESLNAQESPYETVSVLGEQDEGIEHIYMVLAEIGTLLAGFATYKIIEFISGDGLKNFISNLKDVKTKIGDISSAGLIAGAAFAWATSVLTLIDVIANWDSASLITKISAITAAVAGLAAIILTIIAAAVPAGTAKVLKAISIGLIGVTTISTGIAAMKFANGGVPEKGSLFIAGEAGAELIHTMPSGQTGVTNISQFKQAMVEALYEAQDVFGIGSGEVVLNLDGAELARSKRFKSELNRSNSGLHLI